jgi:DNA-binding response OmpR family regulator
MAFRTHLRILVVEDWPEVRDLVVRVMQDAGFEVDEAGTLQEAMSAISLSPPDLVITDYILPEKAERFVPWIKDHHPGVPVIVLSANPQEATEAMPDADVVLGKPIKLAELVQTVSRFVDLIEAQKMRIPN